MSESSNRIVAVLTTIQPPTLAVHELQARLAACGGRLVVAGDRKGPASFELPGCDFLSLKDQKLSGFALADKLPTGHYARKNIGYLHAMRQGATCIYETDDDNTPLDLWAPRSETVSNARVIPSNAPEDTNSSNETTTEYTEYAESKSPSNGHRTAVDPDMSACQRVSVSACPPKWINVYRYFTDELIWPRGLPLDEIHTPAPEALPQMPSPNSVSFCDFCGSVPKSSNSRLTPQCPSNPFLCPSASSAVSLRSPIQQGLVNGSPDVDAIWRLTLDRPFRFEDRPSVYLQPGNWCPFNTQSTWWWPVAYPLLYVPSHCSFRMCDIWRSFVAQRCLWAMGFGVTFHAPEVFQERNAHDLMRDFGDEIPGYQRNSELAASLDYVTLKPGPDSVGANLLTCYEALVDNNFFPLDELELVKLWLADSNG